MTNPLINYYLLLTTMNKFSTLVKLAKKGDVTKIEEIIEQGNANINEVDHKSKQGLIHIAIEHSDEALFHAIVKRHTADLELTTADGETPLEMAVRLNCPTMVQALLEHNVHFRRKNQAGETVLGTAIRNQTHRDILKRLTHNKFDINEPIDEFGSYLNLSVTAGHPDNFYFLIKELGIDYTKKFDK